MRQVSAVFVKKTFRSNEGGRFFAVCDLAAQAGDAVSDAGEGFGLAKECAKLRGAAGGGGLAGHGHPQRPQDDGILHAHLFCQSGEGGVEGVVAPVLLGFQCRENGL